MTVILCRWTEVPKPQDWRLLADWPYQRYGHTVVSKGHTCYLFGGRNDEAACNLLYTFCAKTYRWTRPRVQGDIPGERDGHSAAIVGNYMYVFGGYEENFERFGQDVYRLDLETYTWKLMVGTFGNMRPLTSVSRPTPGSLQSTETSTRPQLWGA